MKMHHKKGLVSCVTPVYNGEKYLARMLDSILNQTYPFVEMILVDDGSTDCTMEIAESYRERFEEKQYSYQIVRTEHKNASAAINRGLPWVTGEYLIWPDSDDILESDSIKKRVEFLIEHPNYHSVRSLMYYFANDGSKANAAEKIGDLYEEHLFFDIMEHKTFVCCGCYMLRTEMFFSIYPERKIPEYPVGQNFQMLLPYMYRYKCYTIPEPLYGVRVRPDSHSRRPKTQEETEQQFKDFEDLIDEIRKICGIQNIRERIRILYWKMRRRQILAHRYGKKVMAIQAKIIIFLCGRSQKQQALLRWLKKLLGRETKYVESCRK
ncbi:MAG: glycosyltransferase family 2 protein [Hespellia sp.]|nr:glycosyltransferase family 2 protein [Hespellia sp.]